MTAMKEATMTEASSNAPRRSPSPRQRRYRFAIGFSAVLGAIIGVWLALDQPKDGQHGPDVIFNGPLSANFAIVASLLWVVGLAVAMVIYHRAIDDHEERAWLWAGLTGWYAFIVPAPVWWVLHRATLAPPVDAMWLFLLSMVANAIVWLWLKYR